MHGEATVSGPAFATGAAASAGMSRRRAAERFGASAASAARWVAAVNTTGSAEAKPQGGDTRSHRIEAFSTVILAAVAAQKDISLVEGPTCCAPTMGRRSRPAPSGAALTVTSSGSPGPRPTP